MFVVSNSNTQSKNSPLSTLLQNLKGLGSVAELQDSKHPLIGDLHGIVGSDLPMGAVARPLALDVIETNDEALDRRPAAYDSKNKQLLVSNALPERADQWDAHICNAFVVALGAALDDHLDTDTALAAGETPGTRLAHFLVDHALHFSQSDSTASTPDTDGVESDAAVATDNATASDILDAALDAALQNLAKAQAQPDFADLLRTAFGNDVDIASATTALQNIFDGHGPRLELADATVLNGAMAAFDRANNLILVSSAFVLNHAQNEDMIAAVVTEEFSHYIDANANATDAPGDEGEIFSKLVQGEQLSPTELAALQTQNDHGVITVGDVATSVEFATTVDGSLSDWSAADRLDTGGGGVDGYELYGRYEDDTYYFAISAPTGVSIGADTTLWLNTDLNLNTGYKVWGWAVGAEYNINLNAQGAPALYTGADGQTLVSGATVNYAYDASHQIVELSIAAASLDNTSELSVYTDVNNSVFLPNSYANYAYTVGVPAGGEPVTIGDVVLDGALGDWTSAERIDASLGFTGYEIYGKLSGDNYIIAIKSPVGIGANTTAWLNTDQNAGTGYQIWGWAGGAEFNVNFDALGNARLYTGGAGETAIAGGDLISRMSADNTIVELAIPKELLGFTGEAGAIDTLYDINDSVFLPTAYASTQYTIAPPITNPPVVGSITLDGALGDWTSTERIDSAAPVEGYEVYGKVSGDNYIFAISAPAGTTVGANTTVWLNTDQNASTGYQIWGSAGGAEFNINFDANGVPALYTDGAGQTPVSGVTVQYGRSADGSTIELAVPKSAIGDPSALNALLDINDTTFLPNSYNGPQYTVFDTTGLPPSQNTGNKIAIVYSETTAARYFGNADVNINETGYAQLFMAAQNQAAMAGVPYDLLSEADLLDIADLVSYDAIVFPSFQFVQAANAATILNNLTLLEQVYDTSLIAAGNFMTADENGNVLSGDPYAAMKTLFDVQPVASGFAGTTEVAITSTGTGFDGVGGYTAGENLHTYSNAAGVGWLAFGDATPGTTPLTSIDTQTITGTGAGSYDAVLVSNSNGNRNVHFSTEALLGDNNQLWQAIEYAVNGGTEPSIGLQMSRQTSIVASRTDMDQSQYADEVNPEGGAAGIYDTLLPVLQNWKDTYNFVSSYYINIGDNPTTGQFTDWSISLPYYQALLAMGNEIGTHSLTHLVDLNPAENTNYLTTGTGTGTFDYEFRLSRDTIETQLGLSNIGVAVPGAPEYLATAEQIIQYFNYMSGGYASVGAGYPGAFGFMAPAYEDSGQVYLAPNMAFDFTLIEYQGMTAAQAQLEWQAEFANLTAHTDVPIIMWPWHDYGPINWGNAGYTLEMFTQLIATAADAGAEFVTLQDLADRIRSFSQATVTSSVEGNVITATVTPGATETVGKFALDVDNAGTQVIANVAGWYAYDDDSVFTDSDGGSYVITLGTTAEDVTHITDVGDRNELVSLTGDGTNLSFTVVGEGQMVVDLKNTGTGAIVTGAAVVSQVGDILTLDLGATGQHDVVITFPLENSAPLIASNGGGDTASIAFAENGTGLVTTVVATDADSGQTLSYSIAGGADAALFTVDAATGALSFNAPPDFETPLDADGNNIYDVIVQVDDSSNPAASDQQALAVSVSNVTGITASGTLLSNNFNGTDEEDIYNGNGGNDTINGNGGNDTLTGGSGFDTLSGGLGADTFVFASASESGLWIFRDTILDFTPGEDKIDVNAFDANTTISGVQDFSFLGETATTPAAGQMHTRYDSLSNTTYVEGNTDNDSTLEFQIKLSGHVVLSIDDFVI